MGQHYKVTMSVHWLKSVHVLMDVAYAIKELARFDYAYPHCMLVHLLIMLVEPVTAEVYTAEIWHIYVNNNMAYFECMWYQS